MDAPNLIQNVWTGLRRICQRSIMPCKILTFGRHPSCCLLRWHRIVCWPVFRPRLSGIWCARCCRGTEHEFSPSCSVLWLWSAVFTPSCWFRLGCVHNWSPYCAHRCFFIHMNLRFHLCLVAICRLNASLSHHCCKWEPVTCRPSIPNMFVKYMMRVKRRGEAHYRTEASIC